ncbi:calcium-binding protein [Shimia abyssi]|uniref:Hemolysin type calcium-binding protein n=1 Tax=Shimia abyssi TaxID=1662395 RepID=A0A2P8FDN6_9RHOB|nr:calcium-binding protein [Shimia abyssi]PSL19823.1 hemolysin type calcium-binding protein [Shimia abyssi]
MIGQLINGTTDDDTLIGTDGDDTINGLSGTDIINGGLGDDLINPGDNADFDFVDSGAGNDTIDFSDADNGFFVIGFDALAGEATYNISGSDNSGTIDKGDDGVTTLLNVQSAMLASGFGAQGSPNDDVFNVTGVDSGFAFIRGLAGNDTFNIVSGPGTVRLDYRSSSVSTGIVADLSTGQVSEDGFGGMDTIVGDPVRQIRGSDLNDSITGSTNGERIEGADGDDTIVGGGGDDSLRGGAGDDVLRPGAGDDYIEIQAGDGDDTVIFTDATSGFFALAHFDLSSGVTFNIDGVANTGTVDKGPEGTTILTDVEVVMTQATLNLYGSFDGDDTFNVTVAEGGNVRIRGYGGNDTINYVDGPGLARVDYNSGSVSTGIVANLATGIVSEDGFGSMDTLLGDPVRDLAGTRFSDDIRGGAANERLRGRDGNDTILGAAGDDALQGEDGDDFLRGDAGRDTIEGGDGNDSIFAGPGDDSGDFMFGGSGTDVVGGGFGNDHLVGGTGSDTLFGGHGGDLIYVGEQILTTSSSESRDSAGGTAWAGSGNDVVHGADGNDVLGGGNDDDQVYGFRGNDVLYLGAGADYAEGGFGDDTIFGGAGNDQIFGGEFGDEEGDDLVYNGGGNDTVDGEGGSDTIWGGPGNDVLYGGDDSDTFAFASNNGTDTVGDFQLGGPEQDLLNLVLLGIASEQEALSLMTDTLDGVSLSSGGTTAIFQGHTVADFTSNSGWFDDTVF